MRTLTMMRYSAIIALFVLVAVMPVSADLVNNYYKVAPTIHQGATVFIGEEGLDISDALASANAQGSPTAITTIGWWVSAADIFTTPPNVSVNLAARANSLTVTQAEFDTYEGQWYLVDANNNNRAKAGTGAVLNVRAPALDLSIRDVGQNDGADVSGTSILQGARLQFRIGTNMYTVLAEPLVRSPVWNNAGGGMSSDGYLDIRLKDEAGATFERVYGDVPGVSNSLVGLNVTTQPFTWGRNDLGRGTGPGSILYVWNTAAKTTTGEEAYPAGTYVGSVQSRLNNMNVNYLSGGAAYTGRTVSETKIITLVGGGTVTSAITTIGVYKDGAWYLDNDGSGTWNAGDRANNFGAPGWTPLVGKWSGTAGYTGRTVSEKKTNSVVSETVSITANKDSTDRTRPFSVTITGSPNTYYNVWVKNTNTMDIDTYDGAPPIITKFQYQVADGDFSTFSYKYQGGGGTNTVGLNAYGESPVQDPGYVYSYALVRTSTAGIRTVEFSTTQNTRAQMYTIRVERNLNDNNYAQGDFTGDEVGIIVNAGKSSGSQIGIYQNGVWYLDNDGSGTWNAGDRANSFGAPGWTPVLGDWNGDGLTEIGIYQNGIWYLDNDGSGTWNAGDRANSFGAVGWTPVLGDWNGDGKTKIGVYQNGVWYLDNDGSGTWNAGDRANSFGAVGWTPVLGDWDGDGTTEIGVYQNGIWYLDNDGSGTWNAGDRVNSFGAPGWTPVLGDWNGDGKTKIGVYQNGVWYLDNDSSGTWNAGDRANSFGAAGWNPVIGKWS